MVVVVEVVVVVVLESVMVGAKVRRGAGTTDVSGPG